MDEERSFLIVRAERNAQPQGWLSRLIVGDVRLERLTYTGPMLGAVLRPRLGAGPQVSLRSIRPFRTAIHD